jgi:GNAT superfamily N-acetyltransferase
MELLNELSRDLAKKTGRDGRESFEFSDVAQPRSAFLLAYETGQAVGCGALRPFNDKTCEVKRMYARTQGHGIGREILRELERLALEFQFDRIWVETGIENQGAVKFYQKHGYEICENWGKYKGRPECICFEKILNLYRLGEVQNVATP